MNSAKEFITGFNLDAIAGWLVTALGMTACLISFIRPNLAGGALSVIGLAFGIYLIAKAGPIHALFDTGGGEDDDGDRLNPSSE